MSRESKITDCAIQRNNGLSIARGAKERGEMDVVNFGLSYARRWHKKLMAHQHTRPIVVNNPDETVYSIAGIVIGPAE